MTYLSLPPHWTPEQAFAVYDFLRDLERIIWYTYRLPIQEGYRRDCEQYDDSHPTPNKPGVPFDDPIPF
jgi:hypothetical protein